MIGHLATRATSARRRRSAAAWRSPPRTPACCSTATCRIRPELIEQFVAQWREGYDVVYGRRVKREAPLLMQVAYKLFYRVFDYFSYLSIPHDAGDFSLMDKRVVQAILQFPERDLFLRGVRAFVGFKQTGVDYVRPERMFGVTTNSLVQEHRLGEEGHPLLQQRPAQHAHGVRRRAPAAEHRSAGIAQALGRICLPRVWSPRASPRSCSRSSSSARSTSSPSRWSASTSPRSSRR